MTALYWVGGLLLGYAVGAVGTYRAARAYGLDKTQSELAGLLWFIATPFALVLWLAWRITDLPAYVARRLAERRKLRAAERRKRLREAGQILDEEGPDFDS